MSDSRLNLTGLTYFYNRLKAVFAKQADLTALSARVDDIVSEGGEPNVIESVKVDGTALTPDAQKAVNIDLSGKQDALVSGTNIKTINNESLLGSGNIDTDDVLVAVYGTTTYADVEAAVSAGKAIVLQLTGSNYAVPSRILPGTGEYMFEVLSGGSTPTIHTYSVDGNGWSELTVLNTVLATASSIPSSTSDLTNDGDGESPFATEAYVDENGGKIDSISVNGTAQAIDTNKNVNIPLKTVNGTSIVGTGDIDAEDVFVATYGETETINICNAIQAGKEVIVVKNGERLSPVKISLSSTSSSNEVHFYVIKVNEQDSTDLLDPLKTRVYDICSIYADGSESWTETLLFTIPKKSLTLDVETDVETGATSATIADPSVTPNTSVGVSFEEVDSESGYYAVSFILSSNAGVTEYQVPDYGTMMAYVWDAIGESLPTKLSDLTNDGDGTTGSTFPTTAQMNNAIDSKISSTYKAKGSVAFANLPALTATNEGSVYNVTDAFTTTADFVEGAGKSYPAGTNVVIINDGTDASPSYKYDVLPGFIDLSDYWNSTNLVAITTAEIDAMMAS